MEEPEE